MKTKSKEEDQYKPYDALMKILKECAGASPTCMANTAAACGPDPAWAHGCSADLKHSAVQSAAAASLAGQATHALPLPGQQPDTQRLPQTQQSCTSLPEGKHTPGSGRTQPNIDTASLHLPHSRNPGVIQTQGHALMRSPSIRSPVVQDKTRITPVPGSQAHEVSNLILIRSRPAHA